MECQRNSERTEEFYDLILPIKNFEGAKFSSIDESLNFLLNPEIMDGPNQYQCEPCNAKRDALKGLRFGKLPDVLTLSLMRFDFNYQTFERMKINDYYKFDLRLDLSKYTGNTDEVYDLCAVIVHRGDPYAGHYHAIIRDTLLEEYDGFGLTDKEVKEMETDPLFKVPLHRDWLPHTREASSEAQEKLRVRLSYIGPVRYEHRLQPVR
jgi:ubiquitin C-terminal hydrolase